MKQNEYIENHTLRCEASYRGGGIEIDCTDLFNIEGAKVSVYQNYLGGGMLGRVISNANFTPKDKQTKLLEELEETLKEYFHGLTNHEGDGWEDQTYTQNQNMPDSAY